MARCKIHRTRVSYCTVMCNLFHFRYNKFQRIPRFSHRLKQIASYNVVLIFVIARAFVPLLIVPLPGLNILPCKSLTSRAREMGRYPRDALTAERSRFRARIPRWFSLDRISSANAALLTTKRFITDLYSLGI